MADGWGVRGTTREGEEGWGRGNRSVVEATIAQLLVDPLADARHVLLAEEQRPLHREAAAVLASTHRGGGVEGGRQVSRSTSQENINTGRKTFPASFTPGGRFYGPCWQDEAIWEQALHLQPL